MSSTDKHGQTKEGETLTDLTQEIRRLIVMSFPGPTDRTTDVVARNVFVGALEDAKLVIQVQAQRLADLDSALHVTQHMEAVMRYIKGRSGKAMPALVPNTTDPRVAAEHKELKTGQKDLLELLQLLSARQEHRAGDTSGGKRSREVDSRRNVARRGAGTERSRRNARGVHASVVVARGILPETATSLDSRQIWRMTDRSK